jgi:hypothetical protein
MIMKKVRKTTADGPDSFLRDGGSGRGRSGCPPHSIAEALWACGRRRRECSRNRGEPRTPTRAAVAGGSSARAARTPRFPYDPRRVRAATAPGSDGDRGGARGGGGDDDAPVGDSGWEKGTVTGGGRRGRCGNIEDGFVRRSRLKLLLFKTFAGYLSFRALFPLVLSAPELLVVLLPKPPCKPLQPR